MKTIAKLADLATVGSATVENLNSRHVRVLALFLAARRHCGVAWQANGTTVELLAFVGEEYCVKIDGVRSATGTIPAIFEAVRQVSAVLEERPTPTARYYKQYGFWADVQDGDLMCYTSYTDGGWDADPGAVEFACQHMLDAVNADFGTDFTMDGFQEGDCNCKD